MKPDMSAEAISARLREVAAMADLRPERRLDAKIGYAPADISRRLREVEQLRRLCVKLGQLPTTGA